MRMVSRFFFLFLFFLTSLGMTAHKAHAELTIAPLSVEMADRNRTAEIHLLNTSNKVNTYRIEWRYMKMQSDGRYEALDAPATEFDLGKAVRVAPRQVTLRPGEKQTVRLSLTRPPELANGDYRAHLLFQSIGETDPTTSSRSSGGVTLGAKANLGFGVPVLYRVGDLDATVKFEKIEFGEDKNGRFMTVFLSRQGLHGTTGDIDIERLNPREGSSKIRRRNLVNIFAEVNNRDFKILLPKDVQSGDVLRLVYGNSKQGVVYAQTDVTIP